MTELEKKKKADKLFIDYLFVEDVNIYDVVAKAQDEGCAEYFLSIIKNNCLLMEDGNIGWHPNISVEDLQPVYFAGSAATALKYLPVITYGHTIYITRFCNNYNNK